ncbi:DUF6308 family protein [Streptomyces sp. NPDC001307]|uniref:DUF6308 family protein n=1 Tax=Streptomyces sp. NPDC001307 TaxID=3364560 RepID=UPI0036C8D924
MSGETVRVGGRCVALDQARQWIWQYFDAEANRAAAAAAKGRPYAFPIYDRMDTGSGPNELNDGDLLAPVLLNVAPKLHAVLNLQAVRPDLEAVLAAIPEKLTLQDAVASGVHAEPLRRIGGLLDGPAPLRGVGGTILMKIMHRKRPLFLPLYDTQVYACYCGPGAQYPIKNAPQRTWAEFLRLLGDAVARDLDEQPDTWKTLMRCAPDDVSVLRVLDVVAWNLGGGLRMHTPEPADLSDGAEQ